MKSEDMQRTLVAEFSPLSWDMDRDGAITGSDAIGWTNLSTTGNALFYEQTTIDLSGYALQKKTFYPHSSFEQRGAPTIASFVETTARNVYDTTIVSSVPLDDASIPLLVQSLPGFIPFSIVSTLVEGYRIDRLSLMHQHQLISTHDTTTAGASGSSIYRVVTDNYASSLEPTAADELYCYRIVFSQGVDGSCTVPPVRVVIPGSMSKEPFLEYVMRLRRSYELANQV
jgi:hypothetical protein